jgi:hypothetical protein
MDGPCVRAWQQIDGMERRLRPASPTQMSSAEKDETTLSASAWKKRREGSEAPAWAAGKARHRYGSTRGNLPRPEPGGGKSRRGNSVAGSDLQ